MKKTRVVIAFAVMAFVMMGLWTLSRPMLRSIESPKPTVAQEASATVEINPQVPQSPQSVVSTSDTQADFQKWVDMDVRPFFGLIPFIDVASAKIIGLNHEESEKINVLMYDTYLTLMEAFAKFGEVKERTVKMTTLYANLSPATANAIRSKFIQNVEDIIGKERAKQFIEGEYFSPYNVGMLSFGAMPITIRVERASPDTSRVMIASQYKRDAFVNDAYSTTTVYTNSFFKSTMPSLSNKVYNTN